MGIANYGAICGGSGVSLTQDRRNSLDAVGAVMAHELGHLLGMDHDEGSEYSSYLAVGPLVDVPLVVACIDVRICMH